MTAAIRAGGGGLAVVGVVLGWAATATAAPTEWDAEGRWLGGPRGGETIVEQLPNLTGGQGSDTQFYDYFGYEVWQREADNILLTQDQTVGRVVWWGFYGADSQTNLPPDGDETMRIRFYGARPGDSLPDDNNIIYEESFLNPQRVATGRRVLVDRLPMEYRYEVDLAAPVSLTAASVVGRDRADGRCGEPFSMGKCRRYCVARSCRHQQLLDGLAQFRWQLRLPTLGSP